MIFKSLIYKTLIATLFFVSSYYVDDLYSVVLISISFTLLSYNLILMAIKNFVKFKIFYDDIFILIISFTLFFAGAFQEAVAIIIIYSICQIIIINAIIRTKNIAFKHINTTFDKANLVVGKGTQKVDVSLLKVDDVIEVHKGEMIPCDGVIIKGQTSINTYHITGDNTLVSLKPGDKIINETINMGSTIRIKITKTVAKSTSALISKTLGKILNDSRYEKKIINYNIAFTLAALVVIAMIFLFSGDKHLYLGLSLLIIFSPSPLGETIKYSYFATCTKLIKNGVLLKRKSVLDEILVTDAILLDKSTTITKGSLEVVEIYSKTDDKEFLKELEIALGNNQHRLAKFLKEKYNFKESEIKNYRELIGGVKLEVNKDKYLLGNRELFLKEEIAVPLSREIGSILYLAKNKKFLGYIVIRDALKNDLRKTINNLEKLGIKDIILLSSDNYEYVEDVCKELGIDRFMADLTEREKLYYISTARKEGQFLLVVGEGDKDAKLLAKANLGVAAGKMGHYLDQRSSDIIILNDDLDSLELIIKDAKRNRRNIYKTFSLGLLLKITMLLLVSLGIFNIMLGVIVNASIYLLAIIDSIYLLNEKRE